MFARFFRVALALPVVVLFPFLIPLLVWGGKVFPSLAALYVVFAAILFRYSKRADERALRRLSWVLPLLFLPVAVVNELLWSVLDGTLGQPVNQAVLFWSWMESLLILLAFGYFLVLLGWLLWAIVWGLAWLTR